MTWFGEHILSTLIILPLLGALGLLCPFFKTIFHNRTKAKYWSVGWSILTLIVLIHIWLNFNTNNGLQLIESIPWLPELGINYIIGIDGLSFTLIALTVITMPAVYIFGVNQDEKSYLALMLIMESTIIGTLLALDLVLFYIFWELMLIPMYFIIGMWGGDKRAHATIKFVLMTLIGSLTMLLAIIYLGWQHLEQYSFLSFALSDTTKLSLSLTEEKWLFLAFALAFAVKIPMVPLHTWLPEAHVEAPTGGSIVLSGLLLKLGIFGLIRFAWPLFPHAATAMSLCFAILGVISIIYAALIALIQNDLKKIIAYSSISHLGYCVLGIAAFNTNSLNGVTISMLNHGFVSAAFFLLAGMLYERCHKRDITYFGGLAQNMPHFATLFFLFSLGAISLPLTAGFIGEFSILNFSFSTFKLPVAFALLGNILGAAYIFRMYQQLCFGSLKEENKTLNDLSKLECFILLPFLLGIFILGIFPQIITSITNETMLSITSLFQNL